MGKFRWLRERYRAWRRGERYIGKGLRQGRVFERVLSVPDNLPPSPYASMTRPRTKLSKVRVFRKATNKWETIKE